MNKVEKAFTLICSDMKLQEALIQVKTMDEMYEYCTSISDGYTKEEFEDFVYEMCQEFREKLINDNIYIPDENLEKVSGGLQLKNRIVSSLLAASFLASPLVGAVSDNKENLNSKNDHKKSSTSVTHKVKDFMKDHPFFTGATFTFPLLVLWGFKSRSQSDNYAVRLGPKGMAYKNSVISSIDVTNYSKENARTDLERLCRDNGFTQGIETDDAFYTLFAPLGNIEYWRLGAWQYYFLPGLNRYDQLCYDDQIILRQCIKFMVAHKDDPGCKDSISFSLNILSSHGGHCDAKATGNLRIIYSELLDCAERTDMKHSTSSSITCEDVFSMLKRRMYSYATATAESIARNNPDLANETSSIVSIVCDKIGNKLGMQSYSNNAFGNYSYGTQCNNIADIIYKELVSCECIIKNSHDVLESLGEDRSHELLTECSGIKLSFDEYCRYTVKSSGDVQKFKNSITYCNSMDENDINELKGWVDGTNKISVDDIISYFIPEVQRYSGKSPNDIGCPEMGYSNGVKFFVLAVQKGYFTAPKS